MAQTSLLVSTMMGCWRFLLLLAVLSVVLNITTSTPFDDVDRPIVYAFVDSAVIAPERYTIWHHHWSRAGWDARVVVVGVAVATDTTDNDHRHLDWVLPLHLDETDPDTARLRERLQHVVDTTIGTRTSSTSAASSSSFDDNSNNNNNSTIVNYGHIDWKRWLYMAQSKQGGWMSSIDVFPIAPPQLQQFNDDHASSSLKSSNTLASRILTMTETSSDNTNVAILTLYEAVSSALVSGSAAAYRQVLFEILPPPETTGNENAEVFWTDSLGLVQIYHDDNGNSNNIKNPSSPSLMQVQRRVKAGHQALRQQEQQQQQTLEHTDCSKLSKQQTMLPSLWFVHFSPASLQRTSITSLVTEDLKWPENTTHVADQWLTLQYEYQQQQQLWCGDQTLQRMVAVL